MELKFDCNIIKRKYEDFLLSSKLEFIKSNLLQIKNLIYNYKQILNKMKKSYTTLMTALFLFCLTYGINAQNAQTKLDQVQLFNKLLGTWQAEIGKDSIQIQEYSATGSSIECNIKAVYNNKILYSSKQVWGYDKISDKLIGRETASPSSEINLYSCRFISKNILEGTVYQDDSHPNNINSKIRIEFKSPDLFLLFIMTTDGGLMQKYTKLKK